MNKQTAKDLKKQPDLLSDVQKLLNSPQKEILKKWTDDKVLMMMEIGHVYRADWEETNNPGLSFFVNLEKKYQQYTSYIIKAIQFSFHVKGFDTVEKLIESELGKTDQEFKADYLYPVLSFATISIQFQLRTGITKIMNIKYLINYRFKEGQR